jgi:anti-sigma B factor antagonist
MPDAQAVPDSIAGRADAPPSSFVCCWANSGLDAAWAHLAGELDIATASQLEQTLDQSQLAARVVVLDLRKLEFIDSSGVHAIVKANSRARQSGRRLVLMRGSPSVDRIFALAGCSDELEIGEFDRVEPPVQARLEEEPA